MVPTWQFHKLLMGFRLCVVHHLLFEYKDPTFTLWKKLVLAFCFLPRSCSWAQRGASKVSLKSHLSLFGAAGEGGAAVGGESSVPGEVLVGMASQLHLSKCTHSLWPKQREFGTAGWTPQLSLRVALMEVSGGFEETSVALCGAAGSPGLNAFDSPVLLSVALAGITFPATWR